MYVCLFVCLFLFFIFLKKEISFLKVIFVVFIFIFQIYKVIFVFLLVLRGH
jgi:hypothetical protein